MGTTGSGIDDVGRVRISDGRVHTFLGITAGCCTAMLLLSRLPAVVHTHRRKQQRREMRDGARMSSWTTR
jgi:hypothetical protein